MIIEIDFAFPKELYETDSQVPDRQNRPTESDCFSIYVVMHSFKIMKYVGYAFI